MVVPRISTKNGLESQTVMEKKKRENITISSFQPEDIGDCIALQHSLEPKHKHWSKVKAITELTSIAREKGQSVYLARYEGRLLGICGLVTVGQESGELYGSPLITDIAEVAELLVEHLLKLAKNKQGRWLRITIMHDNKIITPVLERAGFHLEFSFVELKLDLPISLKPRSLPADLFEVSLASIDYTRFAKLHNKCHKHTRNAPPIDSDLAREHLSSLTTFRSGSLVLENQDGDYVAYILSGDEGSIDDIGVLRKYQKKGIGENLMAHSATESAKIGIKCLRSVVDSQNSASIALHKKIGFVKSGKRLVWQKNISGIAK